MRLDKFLADMGFGTRKEIKKALKKKPVLIDGRPIKDGSYPVDEDTIVYIDDQPISYIKYEYYLLNKPQGYVCAITDNRYPVVMDLIESWRHDLVPVGRLDLDTEGALLITNDGDLNHRLLSPKHHVQKKYYVEVEKPLPANAGDQFSQPMDLGDFVTQPAVFEAIDDTRAYLTITEGKFHQVKRMFEAIGCPVTYLRRESFSILTLEDLETGQYRALTANEIELLQNQ